MPTAIASRTRTGARGSTAAARRRTGCRGRYGRACTSRTAAGRARTTRCRRPTGGRCRSCRSRRGPSDAERAPAPPSMPRTTAAGDPRGSCTSGPGRRARVPAACACRSARRTPAAATASVGRALGDRARRMAAEAQQPVVHDQRAGDAEIDREAGRDLHHVVAERLHIGRQALALGAQDVGRLARMAEDRQLDRVVGDLDADQPAAQRQAEGFEVGEIVGRHRARRVGGVGLRRPRGCCTGPAR